MKEFASWMEAGGGVAVPRDGMKVEERKRKRYLVTCHYNYFAISLSLRFSIVEDSSIGWDSHHGTHCEVHRAVDGWLTWVDGQRNEYFPSIMNKDHEQRHCAWRQPGSRF